MEGDFIFSSSVMAIFLFLGLLLPACPFYYHRSISRVPDGKPPLSGHWWRMSPCLLRGCSWRHKMWDSPGSQYCHTATQDKRSASS